MGWPSSSAAASSIDCSAPRISPQHAIESSQEGNSRGEGRSGDALCSGALRHALRRPRLPPWSAAEESGHRSANLALDLRALTAYQSFDRAEGVANDSESIGNGVDGPSFGLSVGLTWVLGKPWSDEAP